MRLDGALQKRSSPTSPRVSGSLQELCLYRSPAFPRLPSSSEILSLSLIQPLPSAIFRCRCQRESLIERLIGHFSGAFFGSSGGSRSQRTLYAEPPPREPLSVALGLRRLASLSPLRCVRLRQRAGQLPATTLPLSLLSNRLSHFLQQLDGTTRWLRIIANDRPKMERLALGLCRPERQHRSFAPELLPNRPRSVSRSR